MKKERFLLISIVPQILTDQEAFYELRELKELVDAYDGEVVDWVLQHREAHDKGNYIGSGKIEEAAEIIKQKAITIVVLNGMVKPGQLFDMQNTFRKSNPAIQVWDRVDLILHIFSRHAKTAEARLQIELASMRHMGPRIFGMGMVMSRQSGGIGGRGVGETNTELMKRHWRSQMKKVHESLEKLATERERQLSRRKKIGLKTVSIIGYTNAGKTTLYNKLTRKAKLTENALFATLDSSVGILSFPNVHKEALITDTIGFIRNLPTELIEAFKSTLMESIHADLLLHVIDISDPDIYGKIAIVNNILSDLNVINKKQLYVFNKIDALPPEVDREIYLKRYERYTPLCISVKENIGITELRHAIEKGLLGDIA